MDDPREVDDRAFAERFKQAYERAPVPGPRERARIVDAIRSRPPRTEPAAWLERWLAPRDVMLRPITAMALGLVLLAGGGLLGPRAGRPRHGAPRAARRDP